MAHDQHDQHVSRYSSLRLLVELDRLNSRQQKCDTHAALTHEIKVRIARHPKYAHHAPKA